MRYSTSGRRNIDPHAVSRGYGLLPREQLCQRGISCRNCVCPSVRLSVARVLCDKTKQCTANVLISHEPAIVFVFWYQQWLMGDTPFCLKFALRVVHPFEKRRLR